VADRVRITGQLIDAMSGAHVWAERYDRKSDDIFALQDEITLSVVGAIEPSLRLAEIERVKRKRPDSLDAYDLVLQAQPDVYSGMPDRATQALPLLERALVLNSRWHTRLLQCAIIIVSCAPDYMNKTRQPRSNTRRPRWHPAKTTPSR
jgi:hypothetical protein